MTTKLPSEGVDVTLNYIFQDAVASATNIMTPPGGGAGFKVPSGYKFHPVCLHGESDTDLTAGTITFKIFVDGVVANAYPSVVLSDTVQAASSTQELHTEPVNQGSVVSVRATANSGLTPSTCSLDAILVGVLLPA